MAESHTAHIAAQHNSQSHEELDSLANAITLTCLETEADTATWPPFFRSFPLEIRNQVSASRFSRAKHNIEM